MVKLLELYPKLAKIDFTKIVWYNTEFSLEIIERWF